MVANARLAIAGFTFLISGAMAQAAPPEGGGDPALAPWFGGLTVPGTAPYNTIKCCDAADCRPVNVRYRGGQREIFVSRQTFGLTAPDDWVQVADSVVLHGQSNPTGTAIGCYGYGRLFCYVEGPEG